uniref:Uncharacterized protein LOC113799840 n=1 Tax=Dermatophagoides pteronyssinus TaxID=6956 RepID=A0A6P6YL99_DERPT
SRASSRCVARLQSRSRSLSSQQSLSHAGTFPAAQRALAGARGDGSSSQLTISEAA